MTSLDIDKVLAMNDCHHVDGTPCGDWDMWGALGIRCGGYWAEVDSDIIRVMICIKNDMSNIDIAKACRMSESHVALIQYILCSADWCEYGTSPSSCFPNGTENFNQLVEAAERYYQAKWVKDDESI